MQRGSLSCSNLEAEPSASQITESSIMVRKVLQIDISDFEARKVEVASQLISAARDVGFFYIAGTKSSQRLEDKTAIMLSQCMHRHADIDA